MSDQPPVRLDVDADGIATLTLNRPEQLNAFDLKMIEAWRAALEAAEADERVKVVVVTGAGRAFCAGGDFEEMAKFSEMNSLDRKNFLYRNVHRIPLALERMDKPVIAMINGVTVSLSGLKSVGQQLVQIHGQHQHHALLNADFHLSFLDLFAGLESKAERVRGLFAEGAEHRRQLGFGHAEDLEIEVLRGTSEQLVAHEAAEGAASQPQEAEAAEAGGHLDDAGAGLLNARRRAFRTRGREGHVATGPRAPVRNLRG